MKSLFFIAGWLCFQAVLITADPDVCYYGRVNKFGQDRVDLFHGLSEDQCEAKCAPDECTGFAYIVYSIPSKNRCFTYEDLIDERERSDNRPTELFRKIPCQTDNGCGAGADLTFILDGSGSVSSANYQIMKDFANSIVDALEIATDRTLVAAIRYGSGVNLEFNLGDKQDDTSTKNAISSMGKNGGGTNTAGALTKAETDIYGNNNYNRPGYLDVVVLITDGYSNGGDPIPPAASLKATGPDGGVTIIGVGVGVPNMAEINAIVTDPAKHAFSVPNAASLSQIEGILISAICSCFEEVGRYVLSNNAFTLKNVPEWYIDAGISAWHCQRLCRDDLTCIGFLFKDIGDHHAPRGCYHIPHSTGLDLTNPANYKADSFVWLYRRNCGAPLEPATCYDKSVNVIGNHRDSKFLGLSASECQGKCTGNGCCTAYYFKKVKPSSKNVCLTYKILVEENGDSTNKPSALFRKIPCTSSCMTYLGRNVMKNDAYTLKWVPHWYNPLGKSALHCAAICSPDPNCRGIMFKDIGDHPAPLGCYIIPKNAAQTDLNDPANIKSDNFVMMWRNDCHNGDD